MPEFMKVMNAPENQAIVRVWDNVLPKKPSKLKKLYQLVDQYGILPSYWDAFIHQEQSNGIRKVYKKQEGKKLSTTADVFQQSKLLKATDRALQIYRNKVFSARRVHSAPDMFARIPMKSDSGMNKLSRNGVIEQRINNQLFSKSMRVVSNNYVEISTYIANETINKTIEIPALTNLIPISYPVSILSKGNCPINKSLHDLIINECSQILYSVSERWIDEDNNLVFTGWCFSSVSRRMFYAGPDYRTFVISPYGKAGYGHTLAEAYRRLTWKHAKDVKAELDKGS